MSELDARKQTILQAVIIEYIAGAEPIGSELLAHKYPLGVKSATVRNELAELSEQGFLEQPHTSAGRIPSDLGYRYYVDRLIVHGAPDAQAAQKVKGVAKEGDVLKSMLHGTVYALSQLTQLLSIATTVKGGPHVKTAVVSALGPSQALLVLVFSNGHVENRMIACPKGLTLEDIGQANELLQSTIANKALNALARVKAPQAQHPPINELLGQLWSAIRAISRDLTRGMMIVEGEEFMFAQPEFKNDAGALAEMLNLLTNSDILYEAIAPGKQGDVVTIGSEHKQHALRSLSVIRHRFYIGNEEAGTIAIIGPTRMPYERSIPLVDFTAKALSDSLTRYLGF